MEPLVPTWLSTTGKVLAGVLALALGAVVFFPSAPAWVPLAISAAGFVAALLAGMDAPEFAPKQPLVPVALVPTFLSISGALATFGTQTTGKLQAGLLLAANVLAYLAGKAMPRPMKPEAAPVVPVPPVA